jgi:hypothetical protein
MRAKSGLIFCAGLAVFCSGIADTVPLTTTGEAHEVLATIPMQRNRDNLYTVDVSLGRSVSFLGNPQADRLPFIVDTGANRTGVPRAIANQLIADDDIILDQTAHAVTGPFDTGLFIVERLDFGLGPRQVELAVFDERDETVLSAAGILGSNAFREEIIVLDYPAAELRLMPQTASTPDMPLHFQDGLIAGEGRILGMSSPVRVFVDTGANASIVNSALVQRHRTARIGRTAVIGGVSSRIVARGELRRLFGGFEVSGLCAGAFQIAVSDVYFFDRLGLIDEPAILLGMDVLRHARITIDYGSGSARIEGVNNWRCQASQ